MKTEVTSLFTKHCLDDLIKERELSGHVAHVGDGKRTAYVMLVAKT